MLKASGCPNPARSRLKPTLICLEAADAQKRVPAKLLRLVLIFALLLITAPVLAHGEGIESVTEIPDTLSTLVRIFHTLALTLIIGTLGYAVFVPNTTTRLPFFWVGWALFISMAMLSLWADMAKSMGSSLPTVFSLFSLTNIIAYSPTGGWWWVSLALWGLLGIIVYTRRDYRLALAVCVGLVLAISIPRHAATLDNPIGAIANHVLHVVVAALWSGGLIQLGVNAWAVRDDPKAVRTLVRGGWDYVRVLTLALVITGIYGAWVQIGSLSGIAVTSYGQIFVVKMLFAMGAIALSQNIRSQTPVRIGAQVVLLGAALVATGTMTSVDSTKTVLHYRADLLVNPIVEPYYDTQLTDDLQIDLMVTPATTGVNEVFVVLFDKFTGARLDDAVVRVLIQNDFGSSTIDLPSGGDGVYGAAKIGLEASGQWLMSVEYTRNDSTALLDFSVEIDPSTTVSAPIVATPEEKITAMVASLLSGGLLLAFGGVMFRQKRGSLLLAGVLGVVGAILLVSTVSVLFSA